MALLEHGELTADKWHFSDDDESGGKPVPASAPLLLPYARFAETREKWIARAGPLGVVFPNDLEPSLLAPDIARLSLIVLQFPTFRDGRAYSQARLLRERHGYQGVLRARGDVLIDQYFFMRRCGFDSFEVSGNIDPQAWGKAANMRSSWYQPSAGLSGENIFLLRHGAKSAHKKRPG